MDLVHPVLRCYPADLGDLLVLDLRRFLKHRKVLQGPLVPEVRDCLVVLLVLVYLGFRGLQHLLGSLFRRQVLGDQRVLEVLVLLMVLQDHWLPADLQIPEVLAVLPAQLLLHLLVYLWVPGDLAALWHLLPLQGLYLH